MGKTQTSRRRFLKKSAAAAGLVAAPPSLALAAAPTAAAEPTRSMLDNNSLESVLYGRRSRFVTTTREVEGRSHYDTPRIRPEPYRPSARTPLGESTGTITPTSLHFTTQHYYGIPDINPAEHTLLVEGMVERPLVFTMAELQRLPFVSRVHFLECVGNRPNPRAATVTGTHGRMACSEWTGVPLSVLLNEVGVKNGASWVIAEAADRGKHTKSLPLAKALDDVLVAYGQNGEPVRPDHGYPLRLLVPGFEGIYNVKWLKRIKVVDQPYLSFQEHSRFLTPNPKTQRDAYDFGPNSVITRPSGSQELHGHGLHVISGLAWSGAGKVDKVEVSTDGGHTYHEAELAGPVLSKAHTRFHLPWRWNGEEAVIQSRCLDERGQLQPTEDEYARYWGLTRGQLYGTIQSQLGYCNWIQPWKVGADGKVTNGLAPTDVVVDVHG